MHGIREVRTGIVMVIIMVEQVNFEFIHIKDNLYYRSDTKDIYTATPIDEKDLPEDIINLLKKKGHPKNEKA